MTSIGRVAVRLPGSSTVSASLLEILREHYIALGNADHEAAAQQHIALLDQHVEESDVLTQYEKYVVAQWGDGTLPPALVEQLGDESTWSERERMLVDQFKSLRSDYLIATGLGGETGEVLEQLKKGCREGAPRTDKVADEGGDQLYYAVLNLVRHGLRVRDVLRGNMGKLDARRGPPPASGVSPWGTKWG